MLKNDYFKTILISIIFSLAFLIILPRIPIFVNSQLFKIDSYIGGYNLSIFNGKVVINLKDFKEGIDVGGGKKIVLEAKIPDQAGQTNEQSQEKQQELISKLEGVIRNRLSLAGFVSYEVGVGSLQEEKIYVSIPKFVDSASVLNLVSGSGNIDIRKLKNPETWDINKSMEIAMNPNEWVSTGIKNADIDGLKLSKDVSGKNQIQIVFNIEGRKKFSEFAKTSLDKPFTINLNNYPNPVAVAVVSQSLVDNSNADPIITGNFPVDALKDFLIQMRNPLPLGITNTKEESVSPKLGSDFLIKYFISILIGVIVVFGFLVVKFRKYGLIGGGAMVVSLLVFLSFFKIFSLMINTSSIVAFSLVFFLLADTTHTLLAKIVSNLASDKPFNLALFQGLEANKDMIKIISSFVLVLSAVLSRYVFGETRSFISTLMLGSLIIIFHHFYSLKTLLEMFGDNK